MGKNITLTIELSINASPDKVWDALTNPEIVKKYFFGTDLICDWKEGSPIIFKGVWDDKEYIDKGTILSLIPGELIKYNYLSSFSGLEDKLENYANIVYALSSVPEGTKLAVSQDNIPSEEARAHSEANWKSVLNEMKKLIE